jgi:uncharacterized membrane protein
MYQVSKSITISAPVHVIYDYVHHPENLLKIAPNLLAVMDVQQLPNGGKSFQWEYRLVGVRMVGVCKTTTCTANRLLESEIRGGIHGKVIWQLQPRDNKTEVTLVFEYMPPAPLLRKHDLNTILRENELAVETILTNLKSIVMPEKEDAASGV